MECMQNTSWCLKHFTAVSFYVHAALQLLRTVSWIKFLASLPLDMCSVSRVNPLHIAYFYQLALLSEHRFVYFQKSTRCFLFVALNINVLNNFKFSLYSLGVRSGEGACPLPEYRN